MTKKASSQRRVRPWMERYSKYETGCREAAKLPDGPKRELRFAKLHAEHDALMADPDAPKQTNPDPLGDAIAAVEVTLMFGGAKRESPAHDALWCRWLDKI